MNRATKQTRGRQTAETKSQEVRGTPGRPRAIGDSLIPEVLSLYRIGLGYRAITRELVKEGVWVHWSTVRRMIKANEGAANEHTASG